MNDTRTHSIIMDYRQAIEIAIMPISLPAAPIDPDHHNPRCQPSITRLYPTLPPVPTQPPPPAPIQPPAPTSSQFRVSQPTSPLPPHAPPKHGCHPVAQLMRVPRYHIGRDQFPSSTQRFHPRGIELLIHHEQLAGIFDDECFRTQWAGTGRRIDDRVITKVEFETEYNGPQFRVITMPAAWPTPVCRGDVIIFRAVTSPEVKYVVTWTINGDHDQDHAYIQVNALNKLQQCVHSNDADWPTLGFLIPKDKCYVRDAPEHSIPSIKTSDNTNFSPSSPSLSDSSTPLNKRRRLAWKKSMPVLKRMTSFNVFSSCKEAKTTNDMELDIMG